MFYREGCSWKHPASGQEKQDEAEGEVDESSGKIIEYKYRYRLCYTMI